VDEMRRGSGRDEEREWTRRKGELLWRSEVKLRGIKCKKFF
jgi:hypothetical protein